jgi:hypothetical protein
MEVRRPHTAKKGLLVEAETPAGTVPEKFPAAHGKRRVIFTFLALRAQSRSTCSGADKFRPPRDPTCRQFRLTVARQLVIRTRFTAQRIDV